MKANSMIKLCDFQASVLKLLALILILTGIDSRAENQENRPNIIVILADDLGWRDLSVMGSQYYETPAIDQMASEGMLFTQAYAAAPVCAPTRAAMMTGKYPARIHLTAVFDRDGGEMPLLPPDWIKSLPLSENTMAERLKKVGYKTAIMGKWHLGPTEEYWPEARGFDINVGAWSSGRPASYFSPYKNPKLPDGPEGEYMTDRFADEAVSFVKENINQPFFLYLPFYNPHAPVEAPESSIAVFKDKKPDGKQDNPAYAAMIAHLDKAVGRIMETLEAEKISKNTLIIFTSDNGGVHTLWDLKITSNAPLRGEKFQLYEGGIRVPMIVKWPGVVPEGVQTRQLASTQDLLPSIMASVGHPLYEPDIDGIDLNPVFRHGDEALVHRMLAWHYPHYMPRQNMKPASAVRVGNMKLIHGHESHQIELYNLLDDPGETINLADSLPEEAKSLYLKLEEWRLKVGAQMPIPNPGYDFEKID